MTTPSTSRHEDMSSEHSRLSADVYFLIQRFLCNGTLQRTLQTLNEELEEKKILPKRIDWLGSEHDRSVEDMERQYPYIHKDFLYFLCQQASSSLNSNHRKTPSFLSFRPRARNRDGILHNYNQLFNYVTRIHGAPIQRLKESINIINNIRGREITGPLSRSHSIRPRFYKDIHMQRTTIGHLSAVYCLLFDHTGDFIMTGADDLLIKMWSTHTARLIMVFRGASSEIADIAIDPENTLLAAGSLDKILRVWNLQTGAPIAVLTGQPGMITSVNFCPTPCWSVKYLISTGTDGSVAFWTYNFDNFGRAEFRNTPTLYQEKMRPGTAQMICSSFSPGGTFLATGSADHHVRVYYMKGDEGPQRILETEAHTDRVDSMQWAHSGLKFLSGSKDGIAIIWWFERQQWKSIHLVMATKLPGDISQDDGKKLRVTMVAWDFSDSIVVTAVSDHTLKVWKASNGQLLKVLTGHKDEVYVLESHPLDEDVLLSAGHDGQLFVWDVNKGEIVAKYLNEIEGQGHGAIYDAKWSPNGSIIAASDSHGDILTFGFGSGSTYYEQLPKELFFHTDYRPLVRDQNYWVLDEQTQVPPHLMPPPFLVDMDGNPYPPMLQRLVPGRESCNLEQLVPNIVIGNGGTQEVIQEFPRALLQESDDEENRNPSQPNRSQRIRQSTGNWQSDPNMEWKRNVLIPPLNAAVLERSNEIRKYHNKFEMKEYQKQLRQRPHMISTSMPSSSKLKDKKRTSGPKGPRKPKKPRGFQIMTRAEMDNLEVAPDSPVKTEDSSGYSDWMEENEGRKGRKSIRRNHRHQSRRKSGRKKRTSRSSDELETETDTEADESDISNSSNDSSHSEDEDVNICDDSDRSGDNDSQDENKRERRSEKKFANKASRENSRTAKVSKPSRPNSKTNSPKPLTPKAAPSSSSSTKATNSVPKSPVIKGTVNNLAGPSTSGTSINGGVIKHKGPKIKKSENYKLSEWLSETKPKKSPYFPQLRDEIVYFVQGHQLYVEAVRMKNVYQEAVAELPWVQMHDLRDHEFCRVIDIQYQIKPPRLCCLKLAIQDEYGQPTGKVFSVRYHDMPDVLDFFVLKQTYITAISRNWNVGDKFRCMIDDNWWMGYISNKSPACDVFPDSFFMCYEITWTNGEKERMSPWDMEPIDEQRLPEDEKAAIPVLENELTAILYKPVPGDWPDCERDTACKAISRGITQVMELAIAEPFLVPVDINEYPTYARVIEYPIDLSTIKGRFENNFYRRLEAAKYDIGYLKKNAEKFNEKHSIIIKHARILSNLCLEIADSGNNHIDIASVYHQLVDGYESPSSDTSEAEDTDVVVPKKEPESLPSTSRSLRSLSSRSWKAHGDWKASAKRLVDLIYENEDSKPFQAPVDKHKYPTYHLVITTPMDLTTVKNKLLKNQYSLPQDFAFDMRLIFQNSKMFNTNKRSLIYIMTVRLSTVFEEHMKKIINSWRHEKKRQRRRHTFSEEESDVSVSTVDKSENADPPFIAEEKRSIEDSDSDDTPLDLIRAKSLSQTNTESDSNSRSAEVPPIVVKTPAKRKVLRSDSEELSQSEGEEYKPPSASKVVRNMVVTSEEEQSSRSESDDGSARPRKRGLRQRPKRNRNYMQSESDDDESLAKIQRKKRLRANDDGESDLENNSNEVNGGSSGSSRYMASPPVQTERDTDSRSSAKNTDTDTDKSDADPSTSAEEGKEMMKSSKDKRKRFSKNKTSHSRKTYPDRSRRSYSSRANLRSITNPSETSRKESFLLPQSALESNSGNIQLKQNDAFFIVVPKDEILAKSPPINSDLYSDNSSNVSLKRSDHSETENPFSNVSGDESSFNEILGTKGFNNNLSELECAFSNGNETFTDININQLLNKYQSRSNNLDFNKFHAKNSNVIKNLTDKSELINALSQNDRIITCYMLPSVVQSTAQTSDSSETSNTSEGETNLETLNNESLEHQEANSAKGDYVQVQNQLESMIAMPELESMIAMPELETQILKPFNGGTIETISAIGIELDNSIVPLTPIVSEKNDSDVEESDTAESLENEKHDSDISDNEQFDSLRNPLDQITTKTFNKSNFDRSSSISPEIMVAKKPRLESEGDSALVKQSVVSHGDESDHEKNESDLSIAEEKMDDRLSVCSQESAQEFVTTNQSLNDALPSTDSEDDFGRNSNISPLHSVVSDSPELSSNLEEHCAEPLTPFLEVAGQENEIPIESSQENSEEELSDSFDPFENNKEINVGQNFSENDEEEYAEELCEPEDINLTSPVEGVPLESITEFIDEDLEQNSDQEDTQDPFSNMESDIVDPFSDVNDAVLDALPIKVEDLNLPQDNILDDLDETHSDNDEEDLFSEKENNSILNVIPIIAEDLNFPLENIPEDFHQKNSDNEDECVNSESIDEEGEEADTDSSIQSTSAKKPRIQSDESFKNETLEEGGEKRMTENNPKAPIVHPTDSLPVEAPAEMGDDDLDPDSNTKIEENVNELPLDVILTEASDKPPTQTAKKPAEESKKPSRRKVKKESDSDYEPSSSDWESSSSGDEVSSRASVDMSSSEEGSSKSEKVSSSSSENEEGEENKVQILKKFRKKDKKLDINKGLDEIKTEENIREKKENTVEEGEIREKERETETENKPNEEEAKLSQPEKNQGQESREQQNKEMLGQKEIEGDKDKEKIPEEKDILNDYVTERDKGLQTNGQEMEGDEIKENNTEKSNCVKEENIIKELEKYANSEVEKGDQPTKINKEGDQHTNKEGIQITQHGNEMGNLVNEEEEEGKEKGKEEEDEGKEEDDELWLKADKVYTSL